MSILYSNIVIVIFLSCWSYLLPISSFYVHLKVKREKAYAHWRKYIFLFTFLKWWV